MLLNRLNDIFEQEPEQGAIARACGRCDAGGPHPASRTWASATAGRTRRRSWTGSPSTSQPGRTVAFVGRSGSGKTTLVRCLAGLLEPTEGTILYDGVDMRELDYRDLRRQIGFVLQENHLFDDTIAAQHRLRRRTSPTSTG